MYLFAASRSVIRKGAADVNRRLIPPASLLLVSMAAFGQSNEPGWIADAHGCKVWLDNPRPDEPAAWSGACEDGLAQGRGVLQWSSDGRPVGRTDGEFRDGKLSGHGVSVLANGNRYDGEWQDGNRNGHGVFLWANGNRYDGEWRDDKRNGHGVSVWANGDRYDGEWQDGNLNGHGTYISPNGNRYDGEWQDGKPNGNGTAVIDGHIYDGIWMAGCYRSLDGRTAYWGPIDEGKTYQTECQ
jgi:hypothetical protein